MSRSKDGPTEKVYKFMSPCFMMFHVFPTSRLRLTAFFFTKAPKISWLQRFLPCFPCFLWLWISGFFHGCCVMDFAASFKQLSNKNQRTRWGGCHWLNCYSCRNRWWIYEDYFHIDSYPTWETRCCNKSMCCPWQRFFFSLRCCNDLLLIFWQQTELHSPKLTVRPWK